MEEMSFFDRLVELSRIVTSSFFFVILLITCILTIIALVVNRKFNNRKVKIIMSISYICIFLFIFIRYSSALSKIGDSLVEQIMSLLYFPNAITYLGVICVTFILLIFTIIFRKSKFIRYSNIFVFIFLVFLFVLTLDVITTNNIDIYSNIAVYSNKTLVVLIQSTMGVFGIWIITLIIDFIAGLIVNRGSSKNDQFVKDIVVEENIIEDDTKPLVTVVEDENIENLKKKTKQKSNDKNKIKDINKTNDFNEVLSDEDFNKSFNLGKKSAYDKYIDFINK